MSIEQFNKKKKTILWIKHNLTPETFEQNKNCFKDLRRFGSSETMETDNKNSGFWLT